MKNHLKLLDEVREDDSYLLVVLDACRFDYFEENYRDYLSGELVKAYTPARDTFEYLQFAWPDWHDVCYVSGAVPVNSVDLQINEDGSLNRLYDGYLPNEHIREIVDVWNFGWEDDLGTTPPESVKECAIDHLEEDRLVVHFFQPHAPYVGEENLLGYTGEEHGPNRGSPNDSIIWKSVKSGKVSDEKLRRCYESNLCGVLECVEDLVQESPHEEIFITADHGEALGEDGVYAHPRMKSRHPRVSIVPFLHARI